MLTQTLCECVNNTSGGEIDINVNSSYLNLEIPELISNRVFSYAHIVAEWCKNDPEEEPYEFYDNRGIGSNDRRIRTMRVTFTF